MPEPDFNAPAEAESAGCGGKTDRRMSTPKAATTVNEIKPELPPVISKRVLVPVDFSVGTLEMLRYAKAAAAKYDAAVEVLHVIPRGSGPRERTGRNSARLPAMMAGARQELKRLVEILWLNGARTQVSIWVLEGRAHEVILREARAHGAALIILGRRHRSWLSGLRRRHTVQHVLQYSPCPVLVLRPGLMPPGQTIFAV
jgi:nucleotide-binding universal stress UspA family protein